MILQIICDKLLIVCDCFKNCLWYIKVYVRSEKFREDFNIPKDVKLREDGIVQILMDEYVRTAKITEKVSKEKISETEKIIKLKEELKSNWLEHMVEVIDKVMKMRERWIRHKTRN